MPIFISLLRGINVGGHRKIRMADLKSAYEALDLTDITTYLQSGNVVFRCRQRNSPKVATMLERQIESRFGFEVTVLIRTADDLRRIVADNPYSVQAKKDPAKVGVTFLASRPSPALVRALEEFDAPGDEFTMGREEVFLHCPNGYGRTKLNNALFERKLKMPTTARNWKTVSALKELATGL